MQKKHAWLLVFVLLGTLYYLSSIPGLRVLPVLQQVNDLFGLLDVSFEKAAIFISSNLPGELGPVQTFSSDFYEYASENPGIIEFILRKIAHIVVFFVITIAVFLLLREYTASKLLAVAGAFLLATIIAILDEYHQSFVDGRHGTIVDVLINMVGISLAVAQILFSFFLTGNWRGKNRAPRDNSNV
ncbi:VanZ family protein [Natranaerofaba carboxydovora]|uniref:VanZ family protein n=1 Tax=Natranaerofaba carboxydovora TaxID=2742683 RepID=UPI001F13177B|nr:VanZ family protein [Natranaerofaba carboxydovora]UMZ74165.1 VanZ like family protein [Natranaerofaba carboxydovora]